MVNASTSVLSIEILRLGVCPFRALARSDTLYTVPGVRPSMTVLNVLGPAD